jgi:hypothetical protein
MASQTTDSSSGTASGQITRWLDRVRDRINLNAIDTQARKPVRLLVGGPRADALAEVLDPGGLAGGALLLADTAAAADDSVRAFLFCRSLDDPTVTEAPQPSAGLNVPTFIVEYANTELDDGRPVVTAGVSHKPSPGTPAVYRLSAMNADEMRKYLLHDVVIACTGAEIALGAALPVFRPTVAAKLTLDCAVTCLKIAAASALVDHVPILGIVLGGIASAGDTVALTGLQINMLLNIAAAYGKKAEFARVIELLPVIGGGYGWRTLARELSGFIPFAGIPIKAGIAYAGTLVVGQAAAYYYEHGKPLAADKTRALYYDALGRAKHLASELIERARRSRDAKS